MKCIATSFSFVQFTEYVTSIAMAPMDPSIDDPFAYDDIMDDLGDESLFTNKPTQKSNVLPISGAPLRPSIIDSMDDMELSDTEEVIDISEIHDTELQNISSADPYYVRSDERGGGSRAQPPPVKKADIIDYSLIPDSGAFITARCPTTGKNIYFSRKSSGERKNKKDALFKDIMSENKTRGFLMKPVWQLMTDIEKDNQAELKRLQK
jgi:hypothetical protein